MGPSDGGTLAPAKAILAGERQKFGLLATNILERLALPLDVDLDKEQRRIFHAFVGQAVQCSSLFIRKHLDYGEGNIRKIGEQGLLSRVIDKVARLENLKGKEAHNESKEDAWSDIANYALIALMVRAGEWQVDPGHEI
jgi:hypothetical protein